MANLDPVSLFSIVSLLLATIVATVTFGLATYYSIKIERLLGRVRPILLIAIGFCLGALNRGMIVGLFYVPFSPLAFAAIAVPFALSPVFIFLGMRSLYLEFARSQKEETERQQKNR